MHLQLKSSPSSCHGFSLVEMLAVIAIIGIIASIAIPSIGSISTSARQATARRNAQNLASIYQSGVADGVPWGATDVSGAITAVKSGGTGSSGAYFAVKGLDATATTEATAKLTWDADAGLIYNP